MTRRRKFVLFGSLVILVGAAAVAQAVAGRDDSVEVRIEAVARHDLVATVTASGQITPKTAVDVASDITGRITSIPVLEGEYVARGQLLLTIDRTQFQAAVARAEAALSAQRASAIQAAVNRDQAKRQYDRAQRLRETDPNLVSDEQLEQSQQSYDVAVAIAQSQDHQVAQAQAALDEAQDQLAKTTIRAPMAGRITRMAVEEGEVALASTFSRETGLLMTISDLSVIQVKVRVDETDVVRLALNDSAEVTIDAFPDTTFVGRVTKISQSAIQAAGASSSASTSGERAVDYDVEVTLENPPPDIRPDLSATAKIVTDTRSGALSIPIIALTVREHRPIASETMPQDTALKDTEGVFVVAGGVAQFRPVRVGIAGEEHFEVLSGLREGDSIVAGPYQTIRDLADSAAVRAVEPDESERGRRRPVAASSRTPATSVETQAGALRPAEAEDRADSITVAPRPSFSVQVAAVRSESAASDVAVRLRNAGYRPETIHDADGLYKVRIPGFDSRTETEALASEVKGLLGGEPFVIDNR